MKVLVFLYVISTVYLVLADENVDSSISYKVHPDSDPEDIQPQNDQIAESTHSIAHGVLVGHQKEIPEGSHNHVQIADVRHAAGQSVHVPEGLRHSSEGAHQSLSHGYSHPIYVQQYPVQPVRIFGAEASPLQQTREEQNSIGYTTYVEHVSPKDEEEIQSALKEGSVGDIKRLVPKSGISVKLYHNEKNANVNAESQKPAVHSNALPASFPQYSGVHYKPEVPATQFKTHTVEHQRPTAGLGGLQHSYIKTEVGEQQHGYTNSLHLLEGVGKTDQQSENGQTVYFTQPGINSQKTFLGVNEKASAHVNSQEDSSYSTGTSAELGHLSSSQGYGHGLGSFDNSQYQKQWSLESKLEGPQHAAKNVKPFATLQYEIDPVAEAERAKGLQYTQNQPTSYIVHNNYNKHKSSGEIAKHSNHLSNSYIPKPVSGHQANRLHHDRKTVHSNLLSANHITGESVKTGQSHLVDHLGASGYGNSQQFKASQSDHYATSLYSDSETAKSGQQNYVSHIAKNSYVETKNSQNNFDHQKALEGSTSFDIKNAIDSTGSLIHQTNYVAPATETQHLEGIQKQQVAYVIPKIPVLLDNGIHETPIVEGHQVKEFGHAGISSPQFTYHVISTPEVSGKFFQHPRTIVWTSDDLKQSNGLHQSVIKLQLPREEIYHHVKAQNLEFPTSAVSHVSYPQQKQPYVLHYDLPLAKYPQEIHFQPKTKTVLHGNQANHIKLTQPVTVDWSLFKSTIPNFNINSLSLKPELTHVQHTGKKIVPILVRKRKNRSNNKEEVGGVIYGKVNTNRKPSKPSKPNHRQEKNIRVNLHPEASSNVAVKQYEGNGDRKNEFSVSASYKVDRSLNSPNSS